LAFSVPENLATLKYDWTSPMGADKKNFLYNLPNSFAEFVSPDNLETVTKGR
jgi:hypothetical protein